MDPKSVGWVIPMSSLSALIMVVNHGQQDADNLRQLIEFMDEPEVRTATPDNWRAVIGERRLGAVFVGADLSDDEVRQMLSDIGDLDPNVPIVMLQGAAAS